MAAGVTRKTQIGTWHYANCTGKQGNIDFLGTTGFALIFAGARGGKPNTITHPLVYLATKPADARAQEISAHPIAIATEPQLNLLHAIKSAHLAVAEAQAGNDLYSGDRCPAAPVTNLSHSASFRSRERIAPSNRGIKHLVGRQQIRAYCEDAPEGLTARASLVLASAQSGGLAIVADVDFDLPAGRVLTVRLCLACATDQAITLYHFAVGDPARARPPRGTCG